MVSTRGSTNSGSSPKQEEKATAGEKRKEHATSPEPEHKPKAAKTQTTIEETIGGDYEHDAHKDDEMKDAPEDDKVDASKDTDEKTDNKPKASNDNHEETGDTKASDIKDEENTKEDVKESSGPTKASTTSKSPIEKSAEREENMASNILEKGIIYFFTRNRVGIEDAESVGDLQRTYFVLRPLPVGAKLGDGAIPDEANNRLFALPKKTFPKSHSDRFMSFVEKSKISMKELKESFFSGSEYETKTMGTRQTDPVTPVGEGVYAITRTEDRTTHLVYAMTIPTELGEVQEDLGLREQGSFVISVKNPERSGPANARLPQGPEFPKEYVFTLYSLYSATNSVIRIIEEFRGLAWAEVKTKYLDYENCQILLIGEKVEKGVEPTTKDKKHDKDAPKEELEQLEHEDELRVEHLHGKHFSKHV